MSTNLDTKIASEPHPALLIADYLEEHGWVQGHFEDFGGGACCISGAGRKIFGDDVYYGNIYPRVRQLLSMGVHMSVSEWNDAEGEPMKKLSLFSGEGLMGDSVGHQIYKAAAEFFEQGGQWESGLTRKIGTNVFTLDDVVLQLTRGFENEIFEDINRLMQRETGLGLVLTNDLTTMTKERIVQLCNDIASSRELYG